MNAGSSNSPRFTARQTQVLSYLIRNGAASRKQIAMDLSVTGATLTNISNELIQEGLVYEKGVLDSKTVGRRQIFIDVRADYCYALGLDVANRYLRVTLLNMKLELIAMREWRYSILTASVLDESICFMKQLIQEYGQEKILGLGLLGQGYVYQDQFLSLPIHDVRARIEAQIDLDICCMNNIRGLAITQAFLCSEDQSFFMLHYGPGVCSIVVKDGVVDPGYHNKAGEIGHAIWNTETGEPCEVCGKSGCVESILGFDHVARRAYPEHNANYTDYASLQKACMHDDGKALDIALVMLAKVVNLLVVFSDPQEILLCGQIFTDTPHYKRFTDLLYQYDSSLYASNIRMVEGYSEKRWKSAGIVVMNEFFGTIPQRPLL